jgi:hypothetical protein
MQQLNNSTNKSSEESKILQELYSKGQGQTIFCIRPVDKYLEFDQILSELPALENRVVVNVADTSNFTNITAALVLRLSELNIRQANFIGFGSASLLIQYLALSNPKLVRRAILVDPSTRCNLTAGPSKKDRFIDWLEQHLPLGLPLRMQSKDFDSRAFLQRIRCPILLLNHETSPQYIKEQVKLLAQSIPTSWVKELSANKQAQQFLSLVQDFQQVAARAPR